MEASRLIVACSPDDFSASVLARAIEDSDAHLINLNVTDRRLDDGRITVDLRTNRRNVHSAVRSLLRLCYEVFSTEGEEETLAPEVVRSRAAELLHIINI